MLVLTCLAHAGGALTVSRMARATVLGPARLRQVVDKLERRGAVSRRPLRKDRRRTLVEIERAGRELLDGVAPALFEMFAELLEPIEREGVEFMRAKLRSILGGSAESLEGASGGTQCDAHRGSAAARYGAAETLYHRRDQRSRTWGLAVWLHHCQGRNYVDRLWWNRSGGLGLAVKHLHVLSVLAVAGDGVQEDAIADATGLAEEEATSVLSALERAGLATRWGEKGTGSGRVARLTEQGEEKVMEALPMANCFADELYRRLSDEELGPLQTMRSVCGMSAERRVGRSRATVAPPLTEGGRRKLA